MNKKASDFWQQNGPNFTGTIAPERFGLLNGWPVITLWEPWASAIVLGLKRIETRHWTTAIRGPMLIHAAARPVDYDDFTDEMTAQLEHHGIEIGLTAKGKCFAPYFDGTRGRILAYVDLTACTSTERLWPSAAESAWGNFGPDRFGWELANIRRIWPIARPGHQRIWRYENAIEVMAGRIDHAA